MSTELLLLTNVSSPIWQRSIGAYQVASHVRKFGIQSQVIDFIDLFKIDELEEIITSLISNETLSIGISTTFFSNRETKGKFISSKRNSNLIISENLRQLLLKIKKKFPKIKIMGGGANSYLLENDDLFDVVFHGYSEQSVVEWLLELKDKVPKRIYLQKNKQIIIDGKLGKFDINKLDHRWDKKDFVLEGETLPIEISRGCIFKCNF